MFNLFLVLVIIGTEGMILMVRLQYYSLFYKNIWYENIEAENFENLRIS